MGEDKNDGRFFYCRRCRFPLSPIFFKHQLYYIYFWPQIISLLSLLWFRAPSSAVSTTHPFVDHSCPGNLHPTADKICLKTKQSVYNTERHITWVRLRTMGTTLLANQVILSIHQIILRAIDNGSFINC